MRILLALVAALPLVAADSDFNGRWNITTNAKRAYWLEVTGAGGAHPSGFFVSDHGGDRNVIDHIAIENGELRFSFDRPGRGGTKAPSPEYRAKIVDGKLVGSLGNNTWTGVRAPSIMDKEDGSWKEGKPIQLFNGKDLTGWNPLVPGAEMKWSVVDGVLRNAPPTVDIISSQRFWNFTLHVDFRIVEHSNSGIGLRGRYEIQILDDYGKEPNTHGAAALYSRIAPSVNASKPAGEWQSYDIRLVGRTLTVVHNGKKVLDKVQVEGLTAIANNADESKPGPFIVQGDHSYVEIKSFVVTPLEKDLGVPVRMRLLR
jgi:hypothetical protein